MPLYITPQHTVLHRLREGEDPTARELKAALLVRHAPTLPGLGAMLPISKTILEHVVKYYIQQHPRKTGPKPQHARLDVYIHYLLNLSDARKAHDTERRARAQAMKQTARQLGLSTRGAQRLVAKCRELRDRFGPRCSPP